MVLGTAMRRREFITLLGGAAMASPRESVGQQIEPRRQIAVLQELAETDPEARRRVATFEHALERLGWVNGRNIKVNYYWRIGNDPRSQSLVSEVVSLAPEVIFTA